MGDFKGGIYGIVNVAEYGRLGLNKAVLGSIIRQQMRQLLPWVVLRFSLFGCLPLVINRLFFLTCWGLTIIQAF
jgi:hypothetical protein